MDDKPTSIAGGINPVDQLKQAFLLIAERFAQIIERVDRLESLILENHAHQMKQLKCVQKAFLMNVERDEELRTTILESADPWAGT